MENETPEDGLYSLFDGPTNWDNWALSHIPTASLPNGNIGGKPIAVRGIFNSSMADQVIESMNDRCSNGDNALVFVIDSPGGNVESLLSILDHIDYARNDLGKVIVTYVVGYAASCAQFLLSYGDLGLRFATPSSKILIHEVSASSSEEMQKGSDLAQFSYNSGVYEHLLMKRIARHIYGEDGDANRKYRKLMKIISRHGALHDDVTLYPPEAALLGLVDRVGKLRFAVRSGKASSKHMVKYGQQKIVKHTVAKYDDKHSNYVTYDRKDKILLALAKAGKKATIEIEDHNLHVDYSLTSLQTMKTWHSFLRELQAASRNHWRDDVVELINEWK